MNEIRIVQSKFPNHCITTNKFLTFKIEKIVHEWSSAYRANFIEPLPKRSQVYERRHSHREH